MPTTIAYAILTGGGLILALWLLWWVVDGVIRPVSDRERTEQ